MARSMKKSARDPSFPKKHGEVNLTEVVADRSHIWKVFLNHMEDRANSQNKSFSINNIDATLPIIIDEDVNNTIISKVNEDVEFNVSSDVGETKDDDSGLSCTVISCKAVEKETPPNKNELEISCDSVGIQCELGQFEIKYTETNFVGCFTPEFDNEQQKSLLCTFDVEQIKFFVDNVLESSLYHLQISREEARLLRSYDYTDYDKELFEEANRVAGFVGKSCVAAYYLMHKADASLATIKDIIEVKNGGRLGKYLCDKLVSEENGEYYSQGHRLFALEWSRLVLKFIPVEFLVIYCVDLGDIIIEQLSKF